MTLGQAKAMTMKLLDDYMIEAPPTDDEETLARLNAMFQAAQIFLSTIKPIQKACTIAHEPKVLSARCIYQKKKTGFRKSQSDNGSRGKQPRGHVERAIRPVFY